MRRWVGDARLFEKALRSRTGRRPTELTLTPDGWLSGRIGDASLPATQPIEVRTDRWVYRAALSAPVRPGVAEQRRVLMIIVSMGGSNALDVDFHLKTRTGFDAGMHVGHFDVMRAD